MRWTEKAIELRERFSKKNIIQFIIVFAISLILFEITTNYYLEAIFGFIMIISGAIIVLFIIVYLIFLFLDRMNKNKEKTMPKKVRPSKKPAKKTTKKVVKKKTISKKR